MDKVRAQVCQGALTRRLRGAAHLSLVICVSFRIAASAEAPLTPMSFQSRLCERGANEYKRLSVSRGADTKANTLGRRLTAGW